MSKWNHTMYKQDDMELENVLSVWEKYFYSNLVKVHISPVHKSIIKWTEVYNIAENDFNCVWKHKVKDIVDKNVAETMLKYCLAIKICIHGRNEKEINARYVMR